MKKTGLSIVKQARIAGWSMALLALLASTTAGYAADYTELQKLLAGDRVAGDYFGYSVSISGNVAIIGANYDDDVVGDDKGSAYIFTKGSNGWTQTTKLTASDGIKDDTFGNSVSISGDVVIIGAEGYNYSQGAAYIFTNISGSWTQTTKLTASDGATGDYFGHSVSISGDIAIIGANSIDDQGANSGAAYIFEKGDDWIVPMQTETTKLTASVGTTGAYFGESVSISGGIAIVGAPYAFALVSGDNKGAAYIFEKSGSWPTTQTVKLRSSDGASGDAFGNAVSISGTAAIVGAHNDDVLVYNDDIGSAYIFEKNVTWPVTQTAKLTALNGAASDNFGFSVSISGTVAIVGAPDDDDKGSAYIFTKNISWPLTETYILIASDGASGDSFGSSVSISGDLALVGAYGANSYAGAAYVLGPSPIVVDLVDFTAFFQDGSVRLEWNTQSETNTAGFNILKSRNEDGAYGAVNDALISAKGYGANYRFTDDHETGACWYQLEIISLDGARSNSAAVFLSDVVEQGQVPAEYALHQNYPNPFNPRTTIRFDLPEPSDVTLAVYDAQSHLIRMLLSGRQPAGANTVVWDGQNEFGESVASGIYFYQLKANDFSAIRRMTLVR